MQDYTNLQSIRQQADRYMTRLFKRIEELGGIVNREVYITPDEAYDITFKVVSPWAKRYFGDHYDTYDKIVEKARRVAFDDDRTDVTDAMRSLANNFLRQAHPVRAAVKQGLLEDLSMVSRFRKTLEVALEFDSPVYNETNTDPQALQHYYSYMYKFSPLSQYNPDIWLYNAKAYGEVRSVNLTDDEVDILAESVVTVQECMGLLSVANKFDPNSIEATQIRALSNNPTAAYSFPTMTNAKSKAMRKEQIKLAKEYAKDPDLHGNPPFIGQRRIQQGGNVLDSFMKRLFPGHDITKYYPTLDQFDECIRVMMLERPSTEYYSRGKIAPDPWTKQTRLPESLPAREALVDNGSEEAAILLKFPDGTFRFNYKVTEPTPWKLLSDDEGSKAITSPDLIDQHASKNRVVFAGSNPIALNKQSFVHVFYDGVKEWAQKQGFSNFVASWKEPTDLRRNLTNMVAAVNNAKDSNGNVVDVSEEDRAIIGSLSGDDKSRFDNFQAWILWATFNCCIISVPFKQKHHYLIKKTSLQTIMPTLMTWEGALVFGESMPSGDGETNLQDTYISYVGALFDISCRTKYRPRKIVQIHAKYNFGMVAQGDDYEGADSMDVAQDEKQDNFSKLGLVLSAPKSLISKASLEYTRQFTNGQYRYYEDLKSKSNILALHAPLCHALVKVNFGETGAGLSPAIDDVSNINRLDNLKYHPNFIGIAKWLASYTTLGMGTVPQWYVPSYNVKAWRAAGAPKGKSKWAVFIDSPTSLVKVASKEATQMGESINSVTDKSWQQLWDDTTKFNEMRTVKVLNAIRNKNEKELSRLASQVVYEPLHSAS